MRTAHDWFRLYAESHKNRVNELIHWACIPIIATSTLGLLEAVPVRIDPVPWLHPGHVGLLVALAFYATLSWRLMLGMAAAGALALGVNHAIVAAGLPLAWVSGVAWVLAWIAQFVGHEIEGRKPSFFRDVQFLLVGPAWLMQFVYLRVGIPVGGR